MRPAPQHDAPGPILHHLATLTAIAGPVALAQLSQMAMGLTDTLMLGRISDRALAAGGLGANLFFTCLFCFQGLVSGVAVLASRSRGAGELGRIPGAYWSGMAIAACLAVPFFWLMSDPGPLLREAGESPALIADLGAYLGVLRWGVPAGLLGIGIVRAFLPAIGLQRLLLWVIPAGVVLNAGLNYWLIGGGLGLPAYGMRGSAAATTITLWITSLALALLLHTHPEWRHHVRFSRPGARVMGELLAIGVPVSVTTLVEATLFLATGLMVGLIGPMVLAAHTVALSTASVTFMVPMAVGAAANVRVAHEIGAGRPAAARLAGLVAIGMAGVFMGGTALVMMAEPRAIARIYLGADSPALAMAASLLRVAGAFQVFDGIQVAASGALRGLKDTRVPMVLATIGYWGIGFGLGRHLAFAGGMGAVGLWWGLCIGLAVVAVSLTTRFIVKSKQSFFEKKDQKTFET
jgi:MATE family multidrug resistance protein